MTGLVAWLQVPWNDKMSAASESRDTHTHLPGSPQWQSQATATGASRSVVRDLLVGVMGDGNKIRLHSEKCTLPQGKTDPDIDVTVTSTASMFADARTIKSGPPLALPGSGYSKGPGMKEMTE